MLALTPQQRRFVVGRIQAPEESASRVARAAGYSDVKEGSKVRAFELMHNPRVLAALREEAERRLSWGSIRAILGLEELMNSDDVKIKADAINSMLDRTGYGRKTTQDIRVEHSDTRSTTQLLDVVRKLAGSKLALPVIEGEVVSERETNGAL